MEEEVGKDVGDVPLPTTEAASSPVGNEREEERRRRTEEQRRQNDELREQLTQLQLLYAAQVEEERKKKEREEEENRMRRRRETERENEELKRQLAQLNAQLELMTTKSSSSSASSDSSSHSNPLFPRLGHSIAIEERIAALDISTLYRGSFRGISPVAIKVFHLADTGIRDHDSIFYKELVGLQDIPDHPHVGRIHACFEKPSACVVSRFIDGPSLITYLQDNGPSSVSEAKRIALEMALGLQHLHKHGVAHLNLSSWNVLLEGKEKKAVLVDYGWIRPSLPLQNLAKRKKKNEWNWLAPEMMMEGQTTGSLKGDIYSFSIILWELLSAKKPYSSLGIRNEVQLINFVLAGKRLEVRPEWDRSLVALMTRCWSHDPDQRPTIDEVVQILSSDAHAHEPNAAKQTSMVLNAQSGAVGHWEQALALAHGIGVARNPRKALKWYIRAATQGHARAQFRLGLLADPEVQRSDHPADTMPKDAKVAFDWYKQAADQGHIGAMFNVGVAYDKGHGVPKDGNKAREWFQRAAEAGDADAQYSLGLIYEEGRPQADIEKDLERAMEWYRKAAEQGDADAQFALGCLCADQAAGDDGKEDLRREATAWLQKAATAAHPYAKHELNRLLREDDGLRVSSLMP